MLFEHQNNYLANLQVEGDCRRIPSYLYSQTGNISGFEEIVTICSLFRQHFHALAHKTALLVVSTEQCHLY